MDERKNGKEYELVVISCPKGNFVVLPEGDTLENVSEVTRETIKFTKTLCNRLSSNQCPPECPFLKIAP